MSAGNNSQRRREAKAMERSHRKLQTNKCWDEVRGIYEGCVAILAQHAGMAELAKDRNLISFIPAETQVTVAANIRSLGRDLGHLNDELKTLHAQHADKTGGARSEDEMMLSYNIAEQYNLFMERHNGVVLPTAYHILEVFNQAELAREAFLRNKATQMLASSTEDTGAIDVEVKTAPVEAAEQAAPAA